MDFVRYGHWSQKTYNRLLMQWRSWPFIEWSEVSSLGLFTRVGVGWCEEYTSFIIGVGWCEEYARFIIARCGLVWGISAHDNTLNLF